MKLRVNGRVHEVDVDPSASLLAVLRDRLDLTGAKLGCGEGECGACTVLVGGQPVRACITPVSSVGSRPVLTVEGLARGGRLHPVQQAFLDAGAFQCGYCTPGMIMEAVALVESGTGAAESEVRRQMEGHICRCGSYPRIIEAVRAAARRGKRG